VPATIQWQGGVAAVAGEDRPKAHRHAAPPCAEAITRGCRRVRPPALVEEKYDSA
jgi:hypothetical protein